MAATPSPSDSMSFMQITSLSCSKLNETSTKSLFLSLPHRHTHHGDSVWTYVVFAIIILLTLVFVLLIWNSFTWLHNTDWHNEVRYNVGPERGAGSIHVCVCVCVRMMNDKFLVFPGSGWCLKGLGEGGWVPVPSCWGEPEPLSLSHSVSDRLSFSPAHSRAVQPAAITTPLPLCHSNAMQSRGRREGEGGRRGRFEKWMKSRDMSTPVNLNLTDLSERLAGENGNQAWESLSCDLVCYLYMLWSRKKQSSTNNIVVKLKRKISKINTNMFENIYKIILYCYDC